MKTMFRFALLFAFVFALPLPQGRAESKDSYDWTIKPSMQGAIDKFIKTSEVVSDMRTYGVANDYVYVKETDTNQLMQIYDLLACIQLTNPDAVIEVDSGGGYDITIDSIKFAKGSWPVDIRISVVNTFVELEKYTFSILDKITVGTLVFTGVARMTETVKLMTAKCRDGGG